MVRALSYLVSCNRGNKPEVGNGRGRERQDRRARGRQVGQAGDAAQGNLKLVRTLSLADWYVKRTLGETGLGET